MLIRLLFEDTFAGKVFYSLFPTKLLLLLDLLEEERDYSADDDDDCSLLTTLLVIQLLSCTLPVLLLTELLLDLEIEFCRDVFLVWRQRLLIISSCTATKSWLDSHSRDLAG